MASLFGKLSGQFTSVDPRQEIERDLGWLLNTRQGTCVQNRRYGISHLTELGPIPVAEGRLVQEIERCVKLFEPRIGRVQVEGVRHDEEAGSGATPLHFLLIGEVNFAGVRGVYRARLRINHDSYVNIGSGG